MIALATSVAVEEGVNQFNTGTPKKRNLNLPTYIV